MADEILDLWIPIPGFDGAYSVSSGGLVRRNERDVIVRWGATRRLPEQMLTIRTAGNGYGHVSLRKNGSRSSYLVHRLVLLSFVGEPPIGSQCCHNNGIRSDNRLSNLRWGSAKDNAQDKRVHGTILTGERANSAKLTEAQVISIRTDPRPLHLISSDHGVTIAACSAIKTGRNWKHLESSGTYRPKNGRPYKTIFSDAQVRSIRSDTRSQRAIAKEYGVSQQTICEIKLLRRWAHID